MDLIRGALGIVARLISRSSVAETYAISGIVVGLAALAIGFLERVRVDDN